MSDMADTGNTADTHVSVAEQRPVIDVTRVDLGGDVVIITDTEGTILDVNEAFTSVTGFARREAIGANPRLLNSGLHQPDVYERLWETVLAGEVWSGQLVDRHRDGSLRTHRVTLSPVRDQHGEVSQIVAVQRDLASDPVRELAVAGVGCLHTDPTNRCIYADDEAARLLRSTPSELLSDGWQPHIVDEDALVVTEALNTALAGGRTQHVDVRTPHGGWLRLRIGPLRASDGSDLGTTWTLEDVTERRSLQERLERQNSVVDALLASHPEPTAVLDRGGYVIATNEAWTRSSGDHHPALDAASGDDLVAHLRRAGEAGDDTAVAAARRLAEQVTGVPSIGPSSSRLVATPIPHAAGGLVVRLPKG